MRKVLALVLLFLAFIADSSAATKYVRGIRLDPSYLYYIYGYDLVPVPELAERVVAEIAGGGFDTLFLYAYNSYHGGFYPTDYPLTAVEDDLGKSNIFGWLTKAAQAKGMQVIAVMPVNDFRHAWEKQDGWRVKERTGVDYVPREELRYLSPAHPEFRAWYEGFLRDFLQRFPSVDGIEAVEPGFDINWDGKPDFNPEALKAFQAANPGKPTTGTVWNRFRSSLLTRHLALFSRIAHEAGKRSLIVQTFTANPDGGLMRPEELRRGLGFDWNEVMNLPAPERPDAMMAELMFQEGKANHGTAVFTPAWTKKAAQAFVAFVNGRSDALIHVEYSPFTGPHGTHAATTRELEAALKGISSFAQGEDIYAYHLWREAEGFGRIDAGPADQPCSRKKEARLPEGRGGGSGKRASKGSGSGGC